MGNEPSQTVIPEAQEWRFHINVPEMGGYCCLMCIWRDQSAGSNIVQALVDNKQPPTIFKLRIEARDI